MRSFVLTAWSSYGGPWRSAARNRRWSRPPRYGSTTLNACPARPRCALHDTTRALLYSAYIIACRAPWMHAPGSRHVALPPSMAPSSRSKPAPNSRSVSGGKRWNGMRWVHRGHHRGDGGDGRVCDPGGALCPHRRKAEGDDPRCPGGITRRPGGRNDRRASLLSFCSPTSVWSSVQSSGQRSVPTFGCSLFLSSFLVVCYALFIAVQGS